jgi:hypothetical protein
LNNFFLPKTPLSGENGAGKNYLQWKTLRQRCEAIVVQAVELNFVSRLALHRRPWALHNPFLIDIDKKKLSFRCIAPFERFLIALYDFFFLFSHFRLLAVSRFTYTWRFSVDYKVAEANDSVG